MAEELGLSKGNVCGWSSLLLVKKSKTVGETREGGIEKNSSLSP